MLRSLSCGTVIRPNESRSPGLAKTLNREPFWALKMSRRDKPFTTFGALSEQERVRTTVRPGHRRNDPVFDRGTRAGRANRETLRFGRTPYLFAVRDL